MNIIIFLNEKFFNSLIKKIQKSKSTIMKKINNHSSLVSTHKHFKNHFKQ
jgi:hypothetical protein